MQFQMCLKKFSTKMVPEIRVKILRTLCMVHKPFMTNQENSCAQHFVFLISEILLSLSINLS